MKTRKVETKMWTRDDWFPTLSVEAKLLFVYLFTNEHIGVSGIYEISDRSLAYETGLSCKALSNAKKELSPKVMFYKNYVYVKNAEKHDPIRGEKNTLLKTKENELSNLPQDVKDFFFSSPINPPSLGDRSSIDGRNGNGIGIGNGIVRESVREEEKEEDKPKAKEVTKSIDYLKNIPDRDIVQFTTDYVCNAKDVIKKAQSLVYWCESNGKRKDNYRAFLQMALLKDFGKREIYKKQESELDLLIKNFPNTN